MRILPEGGAIYLHWSGVHAPGERWDAHMTDPGLSLGRELLEDGIAEHGVARVKAGHHNSAQRQWHLDLPWQLSASLHMPHTHQQTLLSFFTSWATIHTSSAVVPLMPRNSPKMS